MIEIGNKPYVKINITDGKKKAGYQLVKKSIAQISVSVTLKL
jgi:hypothetical protein